MSREGAVEDSDNEIIENSDMNTKEGVVTNSDNRDKNNIQHEIDKKQTCTDWQKVLERYPEANFLQSPAYGKMAELTGSRAISQKLGQNGYAEMIVRDAKRGRYLEIACGPLLDWKNQTEVKTALAQIQEIARKENCVFVRMRPQLLNTPENRQILEANGLKKSPMHLAAEHTVLIDLKNSEADLLAAMRRQTRYEVRRSEKLGIIVEKSNSEAIFREFHAVQLETAKRQNFIPPSLSTLLAEREALDSVIYIAKTAPETTTENCPQQATETSPKATSRFSLQQTSETSPKAAPKSSPQQTTEPPSRKIAYGLIIKAGKEADYYEAASTDLNRKLPGAYALLWQAMKDLKAEGYERFNLWGIAPPGQPHHRYAGVTTFKTGFGGEVVEFVPAYDLIISKVKYLKNWLVEEARRKKRHL